MKEKTWRENAPLSYRVAYDLAKLAVRVLESPEKLISRINEWTYRTADQWCSCKNCDERRA